MFQKTALDDASDDDIVKTMRQRLRKLYVSPAEALSEAMQARNLRVALKFKQLQALHAVEFFKFSSWLLMLCRQLHELQGMGQLLQPRGAFHCNIIWPKWC